jgi:hypothetical protein
LDGFTDPYWQAVVASGGGGYGVFLIGDGGHGCELITRGDFSLHLANDGHLVADLIVPSEGTCFQGDEQRELRAGTYAIGIGCHACQVAEFRVTIE